MQQHFIGREALAKQFANAFIHPWRTFELVGLDDASNRRYFRVCNTQGKSYIVMDAPPSVENAELFVSTAKLFSTHALTVPEILAHDATNGFVLMQDFGDRWLYRDLVDQAQSVMPAALALLQDWQDKTQSLQSALPAYTREKLLSEAALLQTWFLPFVSDKAPSQRLADALAQEQHWLVDTLLTQPSVCVHRDFHSRNLMRLQDNRIGIIDFQDAVWGPASYDLVSLTRDCYLQYPPEQVQQWEIAFGATMFADIESGQWLTYCQQTALQRHLKVLGLFVRLAKHANKSRYLGDLPLVLNYSVQEARAIVQASGQMRRTLACLEQAVEQLPTRIQDVV